MLVSPLAHVSQKRPFDDDFRTRVEQSPAVSYEQGPPRSLDCLGAGTEVLLNIYDVTHDSTIQKINGFFANSMAPLKFGGLFHVGIEILNVEWAYGWSKCGTGVTCGQPRSELQHRYRETVPLSKTKLSLREVDEILGALILQYRGRDYHMIERNCCHFAEEFCKRLGVDPPPAWVHRAGQLCDSLRKASKSFGDLQAFHLSSALEGPGQSSVRRRSESRSRSQSRSERRPLSRSSSIHDSKDTRKQILCV